MTLTWTVWFALSVKVTVPVSSGSSPPTVKGTAGAAVAPIALNLLAGMVSDSAACSPTSRSSVALARSPW